MRLSAKQKTFLDDLDAFYAEYGHAPSHQEMADYVGFRSKGTISDYVKVLRRLGYDSLNDYCCRPSTTDSNSNSLPLLGRVAAGAPIEAHLHQEFVPVPSTFIKPGHNHYCLEVSGDSMIDDAILDGDHVVIRRQTVANNGQTVVASINGEATLKKYQRRNNKIELHPANSKYKPIKVSASLDFHIEGVLVGVLRQVK